MVDILDQYLHLSLIGTRKISTSRGVKTFLIYWSYVIILSAAFILINLLISLLNSDQNDFGYGKSSCYINSDKMMTFTFGIPVGFSIITNIVIVTKWIKSCLLPCFGTFKMPFLMFISILVFRPEGQIWNPVRRDTKIYVRRILNASRISKNQLNSSTISQS